MCTCGVGLDEGERGVAVLAEESLIPYSTSFVIMWGGWVAVGGKRINFGINKSYLPSTIHVLPQHHHM